LAVPHEASAVFSYEKPRTLDEALACPRGSAAMERKSSPVDRASPPMLNMRLAQPGHLIDINGFGRPR